MQVRKQQLELDMEQDWFQIGKGVHQGCILSPCLFNLYVDYTMRNARLEEAQARIKITGRNINNIRYADDTTLMAESEEELKSLLMKTVSDLIFWGSKITTDGDCSHEIKRHLLLGRKVMTNLHSIFKHREITLLKRVRLVKAMVFPVVMYGC